MADGKLIQPLFCYNLYLLYVVYACENITQLQRISIYFTMKSKINTYILTKPLGKLKLIIECYNCTVKVTAVIVILKISLPLLLSYWYL